MHLHYRKARRAVRRERAPVSVGWVIDNPENGPDTLVRQARWLASRLGLTPLRARTVAELAFCSGGPQ